MGWREDLMTTVNRLWTAPVDIYHEYTGQKPQKHHYQGAAGRQQENVTVIPDGPASYDDFERQVFLACRVVAGGFAGETLGMVAKLNTGYQPEPHPFYHWSIKVGLYVHQLQATSLNGGSNYYANDHHNDLTGGWTLYPLGSTRLNDVAIRDVGE